MRRPIAALLLTASLFVGGCSGGDDGTSSDATPSPSFEVPAGLEISPAGTEVSVGESLTLAFADETALALKVESVNRARARDLALFNLPDGVVPYYVRVVVANRGPAPASFGGAVPWWVHTDGDVLLPPTATPGGFAPCRAPRVPEPLPVGASAKGCLLFLVPADATVSTVDFQPADVTTAVRWTP